MGKVRTAMSVSLDGFVGSLGEEAWADHDRVHSWVYGLESWRAVQGMDGGDTGVDNDVVQDRQKGIGAFVMGRRMFDTGDEPWGEEPPFHAPVFVVTSRPREIDVRKGGTSFTFVDTGVEAAILLAKQAAGDGDVFISGGASPVQQALGARLLDELQLHVVPVLLGTGVRLFEETDLRHVALERSSAVVGEGVTHLTYRIVG